MERRSVESIVQALNEGGVRYLVVGGLAVVAHGFLRLTADVDMVLALDEANVRRAADALERLGYRPRAPVPLADFASAENRRRWIEEKGLTVFSLFSPYHPATEIDLFVEEPFDFEAAYGRATHEDVAPGCTATFVGFEDLVRLKKAAGRPKDLEDLRQLHKLRDPSDDE